ncbi:MAG: hypothetical protein HY594_02515 [Candidatus Omnitrophica bacterium]|nr:hypothetical protein [Candidatus Omnitrophota bacterium]
MPKKAFLFLWFALVCVGMGIGGLISLSVLDKSTGPAASSPRHSLKNVARENKRLLLEKEESEKELAKAALELQEIKNDRAQLLDRIKQLMMEKDDLSQERDQLRQGLAAVEDTIGQSTEEITRLRSELESARKALQQPAATPPPPPAAGVGQVDKLRIAFSREEKEIRKDMEFIFDRERQKFKKEAGRLQGEIVKLESQAAGREKGMKELNRRLLEIQKTSKQAAQEKNRLQKDWAEKLKQAQAQGADKLKAAENRWTGRVRDSETKLHALQSKDEERRVTEEQLRSSVTRDWTKLYVRLGALETRQGNFKEAENAFKQAIFLQPTSGVAHYNLGVLYDDYMARPDLAIREYEQYLLLTPNAQDAKTVQGWLQYLKSSVASEKERDAWNRPGPAGIGKTLKQMLF